MNSNKLVSCNFPSTIFLRNFCLVMTLLSLTHEFLGPSDGHQHQARFLKKKSRIVAGDVTVGTKEMKIISVDRLSVKLSCDVHFQWHMPICADSAPRKYAVLKKYTSFQGPSSSALSEKKSKAQEHIQIIQRCDPDYCFQKTRSVTVRSPDPDSPCSRLAFRATNENLIGSERLKFWILAKDMVPDLVIVTVI